MSATGERHQIVISTDGHCGADLREYKPYLEEKYQPRLRRLGRQLPRRLGRGARPGPGRQPALGRRVGGRPGELGQQAPRRAPRRPGHRRRGAVPQHSPAVLPVGRAHLARAHARVRTTSCASPACARTTAGSPTSAASRPSAAPASRRSSSTTSTTRSPRFGGRRKPGSAACCFPVTTCRTWRASTTRSTTRSGLRAPSCELPIHRHASAPTENFYEGGPASQLVHFCEIQFYTGRAISHLIFAGVFERYPDLKYVTTEIAAPPRSPVGCRRST